MKLNILKNSISLVGGESENFGLRLNADDVNCGGIGLGYMSTSWSTGKPYKAFEHGLVFSTSTDTSGGFCLRDNNWKNDIIYYTNSSRYLTLRNVWYITTPKGGSADLIMKSICDFWGSVGNNWTYTYNYYYAGIFVMNSGSYPSGYEVASTGKNGAVSWYW